MPCGIIHQIAWGTSVNSLALILKTINLFLSETVLLLSISETIAGYRGRLPIVSVSSLGRTLNLPQIIDEHVNRYCNRFIHIGRPIFSVNRSGTSVYLTITTTFGNAHARCYTREAPLTQSVTQVGSSLLDGSMLWLFRETVTSPKIVFTSSPTCFAGTT